MTCPYSVSWGGLPAVVPWPSKEAAAPEAPNPTIIYILLLHLLPTTWMLTHFPLWPGQGSQGLRGLSWSQRLSSLDPPVQSCLSWAQHLEGIKYLHGAT